MTDIELEAKQKLAQYKEKALQLYPQLGKTYQFKKIRLIFTDSNKTIAGQAWRSSSTIELSKNYLEKHKDEVLVQILGHEFCHLIAPLLHGDKGDGHTSQWKKVMKEMGLKPETYHNLE